MKRCLLGLLFLSLVAASASAQKTLKRELRGAWIATYANIDWPNKTQTPAQQRAALISILDHHKATGINVIYLQVRSECDAMYPSSIEPWAIELTGTQGKNPGWDPLAFAIDECHKRGIEFHAWINPYRAAANFSNPALFTSSHVTKQHPEWLMASGNLRTLNPGIPAVRSYILSVITDIVQRYDLDGIHFDDYFYPNAAFDDNAAYAADPRGITDRGDWRRDNVNILVRQVNETITGLKPWVKFGVSPSGIYRNSSDPAIGSATSGLQHYISLYADSRKWLQQGWVDYIEPQVYWYINQPGADYKILIPWWNNQASGRHIYIGMAGYKVGDPVQGANWANPSQIPNEVRMNRNENYPNIYGQSVYNTNSLKSNKLGFRDSLRFFFYQKPALLPNMPWRDNTAPDAPTQLTAQQQPDASYTLHWSNPAATSDEMNKVRQLVIYRSLQPNIDIEDTANLLDITNTAVDTYTDHTTEPNTTYYYVVTALDRLHNESLASNTTDYLPPVITCPGNQLLSLDAHCSVVMPDYRSLATVSDDVSTTAQISITQSPAAGTTVSGRGDINVTLTATDFSGKSATCSFVVTKQDVIAPVITGVSTNPSVIMSPNHKMKDVQVFYTATDNCGDVNTVLTVSSNEPENGDGDGDTAPDWQIVDNHRIKLRAERSGAGDGRIYTITITATDAAGNSTTQSVTVSVPHNNSGNITTSSKQTDNMESTVKEWQIKVLPNPTAGQFSLVSNSASSETMKVSIRNSVNAVVETINTVASNAVISFGGRYLPGVYFVEITKGSERKVLKLVKLAK